ncbi:MAG: alkaline phosphatase family protein [Acidimicrobiales bacterium]
MTDGGEGDGRGGGAGGRADNGGMDAPGLPPEPVLPDFGGRCLTEVVPALLAQVLPVGLVADGRREAPEWLPAPVRGARQVVLLVLDGLGAEQLAARATVAPVLVSGTGTPLTSVVPSTTATALTSLSTGLPPAVHGTVGYRVAVGDEILNILGWRVGTRDGRRAVPAPAFQPHPAFPGASAVPVVSRADYAPTGFTAAHLGDTVLHGWHTPAGIAVEIRQLLERGEPFVYAYYDGIDRTAHARGLGDHYEAELRAVDRLIADVLDVLPRGAALVVTADHGQVEVGNSVQVLGAELMDGVRMLSGEGRFRWLHTRVGAADDVAAAARARFGHLAWVRTLDEIVAEGWLGGEPSPAVRDRLGDVALVPHVATAFLDPADPGEQRLVSRHGSLTSAEMMVPLLAWLSGT